MLKAILFKNIKRQITEDPVRPRGNQFAWIRYAVAAMLVLGVGLTLIFVSGRKNVSLTEEKRDEIIVLANSEKNIKRSVLPDGSTAWIHPNSSLSYPTHFAAGERTVSMTGEVFFEVTSDSLRPFVVYSGGIRTRVLGTSFSVRSYETDPYAKVSVVTGKVSVSRIEDALPQPKVAVESFSAPEIILIPDESAVFSVAEQTLRKESGPENPEMAMWTKSNVSFENVPVRDVLKTLNRVYRVKIVVAEKELEEYILRADFSGINLPDALEILGHSFGLNYEMDDDLIILSRAVPDTTIN